jgi:RNA polymerase sigma factor (TIGR02999 family)
MVSTQAQVTRLLRNWSNGDHGAFETLAPLIVGELRKIARFHMAKENPGHTLQPTALVNEAYLKLVDVGNADWKDRKHFYAAASKIMRELLIDYARKKRSIKRGGDVKKVPLEEAVARPSDVPPIDLLVLNEALGQLQQVDPRKVQVVEMWYFGGLRIEEIADVLDVSAATVNRDIEFARVWLARAMKRDKRK